MSTSPAQSTSTGESLAALDRQTLIHPFSSGEVAERVVMAEGVGCRLTDVDGREYLDATGGLWLAQVGHGRPEIARAAAEQIERLEYFTSFWEFSNERAIELASRLVELSPPRQQRVFYTSGGSEGNETALKMARLYHHRRGQPERTWLLARHRGYHGVATGSGTLTGMPYYHDGFGPLMPDVWHVTPPYPYRTELYDGEDPTDFCLRELEAAIEEIGSDRIAAMVGEPIMGVAGMVVPPADYWPRVQELLRAHDILLIFDEVVTAYGRLGTWFGAEYFGVEPDIVVTAKGLTSGYAPLGAVLVSDEIGDVLTSEGGFPMGFTYNGHPVSCAIALANLDIIANEGLLARAAQTGALLLEELRKLTRLEIVGEVRGAGMMLGIELVSDRETRAPLPMDGAPQDVIRRETGVIVRDAAGSTLVLSPPLVMSDDEARTVAASIGSVLERVDPTGTVRPAA